MQVHHFMDIMGNCFAKGRSRQNRRSFDDSNKVLPVGCTAVSSFLPVIAILLWEYTYAMLTNIALEISGQFIIVIVHCTLPL